MNKLLAMALLVNFCTSLAAQTGVTDKHNLNPASTLMEDLMAGQWKEEVTLFNKEQKPVARFAVSCDNKVALGGNFVEGGLLNFPELPQTR